MNIATLTGDALIQRLHGMGPFLEELTRRLLVRVGEAPCRHGRVLRVSDGTSLGGPASKGTDRRIHGVRDLGGGGFSHLEVTDGRGGEVLDRGRPVAGEIRLANPRRKRRQAVNYTGRSLSWCLWGEAPAFLHRTTPDPRGVALHGSVMAS